MTITSRAKRRTSMSSHNSVSESIGPGSYSIENDRGSGRVNYAAFSSTVKRHFGATGDAVKTPGPGSYGIILTATTVDKARRGAGFGTTGNRIGPSAPGSSVYRNSTILENPGPGSYQFPKSTKQKVPGYTHRAVIVPVKRTVPTIPQRLQSFGYEQMENGKLKQQRPPKSMYTGMLTDSVGPAFYSPAVGIATEKRSMAMAFGKSTEKRELWNDKAQRSNPGPGEYEYTKQKVPKEVTIMKRMQARPSSMFASTVPILHRAKRPEDSIGPGSYASPSSFKKTLVRKTFGGETNRNPYGLSSTTPGPGSYGATNLLSRFEPPKAIDLREEKVAFSCTSERECLSKLIDNEDPGPGTYHSFGQDIRKYTERKKRVGKLGIFGSTSHRFTWSNENDDQDENAQNHTENRVPTGKKKESSKEEGIGSSGSSMFQSTTSRFQQTKCQENTSDEIKIMNEEKKDSLSAMESYSSTLPVKPSKRRVSFGSNSTRQLFQTQRHDAGPGTYTEKATLFPTRTRSLSVRSTMGRESRFSNNDNIYGDPGAYDQEVPFLKKTYNVTMQPSMS